MSLVNALFSKNTEAIPGDLFSAVSPYRSGLRGNTFVCTCR